MESGHIEHVNQVFEQKHSALQWSEGTAADRMGQFSKAQKDEGRGINVYQAKEKQNSHGIKRFHCLKIAQTVLAYPVYSSQKHINLPKEALTHCGHSSLSISYQSLSLCQPWGHFHLL